MNLRKNIVILAILAFAATALLYFIMPRDAESVTSAPVAPKKQNTNATGSESPESQKTQVVRNGITSRVSSAQDPTGTAPAATSGKSSGPLIRTAEGRIDPSGLGDFQPMPYPGGEPAYEGEKVTAYIAVPSSSRKVALSVNQLGEFPRIETAPSESVEVRLAFTSTQPGGRVAVVAQDGGKLHTGKLSAALPVDDARQIAFAFTVSPNVGTHRVSITTPTGEVKTLEFWAGPPPVLMRSAGR